MITIFTPVYNRANIIGNLFQSLLNQTCYDFEWLIIDDGSKDSIADAVQYWIKDNNIPFKIRFYQQKNGGKHRAINRGVQYAKGDAFFIVDSDDILIENAVELICGWWKDVEAVDSLAGIAGLRANLKGEPIGGKPLFKKYIDANNIERKKYGLWGDKAEVYKTSVLKRNPFPEFEGENFLTEAVVWDKIAHDGFKIRWYNKVIYLCEYLEGGLTRRGWELCGENPRGWGYYIKQKCIFYKLNDSERIVQYLEYYILTRDNLSDLDIMSNLGIDESEFERVVVAYHECIERTIRNIGKNIAIYGLGARGRKLLKLYQNTPVTIDFTLDKKQAHFSCAQIEMDGQYPSTNAIIITPKYAQDEIISFLSKKTENRIIRYDEWKSYVGLGQDF